MEADDRALRILDEIANAPRESGSVTLSRDYLDAIRCVESLPQNQSGADKGWIARALEQSSRFPARAVLKP